jgi:hypothetical protein
LYWNGVLIQKCDALIQYIPGFILDQALHHDALIFLDTHFLEIEFMTLFENCKLLQLKPSFWDLTYYSSSDRLWSESTWRGKLIIFPFQIKYDSLPLSFLSSFLVPLDDWNTSGFIYFYEKFVSKFSFDLGDASKVFLEKVEDSKLMGNFIMGPSKEVFHQKVVNITKEYVEKDNSHHYYCRGKYNPELKTKGFSLKKQYCLGELE